MASATQLTSNRVEKSLKQGVKQQLTAAGMRPSTKRGNKELSMLVKRVAQSDFQSVDEVDAASEKLGSKIVELSQASGKQQLDAGTIRKLSLQKGWASMLGLPEIAPKAATPTQSAAKSPAAPAVEAETTVDTLDVDEAAEAVPSPEPEPEAEPAETALSEAATEAEDAAAAEVVEAVADSGTGAATAVAADPEAIAAVSTEETPEEAPDDAEDSPVEEE
ncbi:MAG: hypothetical protein F6J97_04010 [Leptolyngbya sp. SIO4C1]|nr:hypothetical protein [Leptolyngbya sp. SIO4C1]